MKMTAQEYRTTLTPLQQKAFYKLLESKLRDSGYYSRNCETSNKINAVQSGAVKANGEKFQSLRATYEAEKHELENQIRALQEKNTKLWETFKAEEDKLYNEAYLTVEDKVQEIQKERGNSTAERIVIESLAVAEYQKRLEKRAKQHQTA
jgi:hypothetical protein